MDNTEKINEAKHRYGDIDDMTRKWLLLPIRLEYQYSIGLQKTAKPKPVGRLIISGCDGPTGNISSFVCLFVFS